MKKFAFISLGLPPSQSGQSLAVYHLLREFDPTNYCLITLKNFYLYRHLGNCSERLAASYHFVNPDYQIVRGLISIASKIRFRSLLDILLRIRIYQYRRILIKEKCEIVIGCTGDLLDPPAAFFASKSLGIPFILYTFDYYSRQRTEPLLQAFADKMEKEIVCGAARVIVPNECLKKEYLERYDVCSTVIHNPFDLSAYEKKIPPCSSTRPQNETQIVYTGAIYEAHYSAFKNLIAAMEMAHIPGLKLHIYTPQSELRLEIQGICGPVVIHKHLPNAYMPEIQHNADVLFLPLSFESAYPDIIRTSAPGKIGEYLASGTPVLVHAPKESFISWFFSHYRCGIVVSDNDPAALSMALAHILSDRDSVKTISDNAYRIAQTDFDAKYAREKFLQLISSL